MNDIEAFAAYYHSFNQISEARAREQVKQLRQFEAFAGVPITEADDGHLRDYLASLVQQGLHPNTIRKRRGMILPFYGWAFDSRMVDADRLMRMQRVRNPRGASNQARPKPYARKEIQQFWKDLDASWPRAENYVTRWLAGRSRWHRVWKHAMRLQIECIAHLALHAGLRRSEIYNAPIDDFHFDNQYVVVRHAARKNMQGVVKPREVPMTAHLAGSVKTWLEFRDLLAPSHDFPWLSLSPFGPPDVKTRPMDDARFNELLRTVGKGYELHRLRHTCATEWLRSGVELENVQRLLGHGSLQQTLAYAEIVKADLHRSMSRSVDGFSAAVGRAA